MHSLKTLSNGLTLITVDLPHLNSVTTLVAVGAGSRYETKRINGIAHFLEHMFFKGSVKFPTAEQISTLVDGIGAINNAFTYKEYTGYWIKSASKHTELASDIVSSMIKESLLATEEIEREKGVIVEELRMVRDNPSRYVWDLYEKLQFGDQPLGWDLGGEESTIVTFKREDLLEYMDQLYSPKNMVLVYAGKLPEDLEKIVKKYFSDLLERNIKKPVPFKSANQVKARVSLFYKDVDQGNFVLGVESYGRKNKKRYAATVLGTILGEGMSSRLFIQVRERRGLAYTIGAGPNFYTDTGTFTVYGGLKLEKIYDGLEVIIAELERVAQEKITEDELKKSKEMIRGRLAIRQESTNFLAEYFGSDFVLDRKVEEFDQLLKKIDQVSLEDVQNIAKELFVKSKYNLQLIGPFKNTDKFEKILS